MLLIVSGPKKKRAKSNTVPAISSMKRPIEDEHEDGNYQARSGKKRKTVTQATSAVSEHCIVDKIQDLLDKKLFSVNKTRMNGEEFQNSTDKIILGKLLQSKDDEKNSLIEHFEKTHKDLKVMLQSKDAEKNSLMEHVMESEKGLKVSMQQASAAAAAVAAAAVASHDRALFRRYVFLFSMCFILLFFFTIILTLIFGQMDALMTIFI
jgi:hypothetical protein